MADGRDEPVIVPIRQSPPRAWVLLALVPVGAAVWIAVEQSWESIVIGGLLLVVSGWVLRWSWPAAELAVVGRSRFS